MMKSFLSVNIISFNPVNFVKHSFFNKPFRFGIHLVATVILLTSVNTITKAQNVANPPQELVETIGEIDKAANEQNLEDRKSVV